MSYKLREWKLMGKQMRINGHYIFYIENHDGERDPGKPTLMLIHGYPTSSWDWERIWPLLTDDFNLIAMDLLGFGLSDKPYPHAYLIQDQADIIETMVERLKIDEFHVLAHDYGDTVAQELLARQNEREQPQWLSLCMLNGGLIPESHKALLIQKLLAGPLGPFMTRHMKKPTLARSLNAVFGPDTPPDEDLVDGFWEAINYNNGRRALHKLIDYMRQRKVNRSRWVGALQDTKVPIGLINGSLDPISGAHMIKRYKEVVGLPLMILSLADIGHYPQVEAPDQVFTCYKQFIGAALD
ncbi:alpha/beta hydrolase [Ketobacter sp. MCCC 1A13808]|uniref:alpha/beta fold hydrolase n=1 Tax=Ketobacter sp. MCCC 1A13808 TaxID=2602738 RepID=UPI000F10DC13|nr:alpha/beta hydrolase [Ketobacter sp. MCCC 1A13808]MVF11405.1 alpha/beta hydrolase [Ketobacter sp. MCCC 1A13808]RLP54656.1 MAG: alpha/beta hydrolase [Ketobacter sp.]